MSDSEQGKETDSLQDQRLQRVLSARQKETDEELKWLKHRRQVGEALELEYDHWAMIAVNLWEKRTAMLFEEEEQSTNIIQSRVNSLDDESELSDDTVNFLKRKERRELQELEQRQLVLKSLQHSQHKFHKAALLLFGRNELTTRSQIQKRSGNCLVTELQSEDVGIDPELQNRVKKQSQSLVGAIFSVPSSKKRLHKELLKQTRQGFVKKRLTQSASHASTSFVFDADSSSEISNTSSDRKIKKQKKKRHKINTLPYSRRNLSHSIPKKLLNSNHMNGIFKMYVPLNGKEDTLEELSEVESVSSTTTIVQLPAQVRSSANHITAPSPLRASSRTPVIPETNNDKLVPDYDYSSNRIATDGDQPETKSDSITITTNGEEKESNEDLLTLSQFHGHETHSIGYIKAIPHPSVVPIVEVAQSSVIVRQESSSSHSSTNSYNQSWSESSMSYSTSSLNTKSVEDDDDESPLSSGLNNNDFEIPMLPPIPNCSTTFGIQTTMSWLDRYSNNDDPPSRILSQTDSTNSDCDSPEISDTYSAVASDPGLTPFITSDVHPLSDAFLESMNSMNTKWEGVNVPDKAWQDPGFREYSNTLSHEPTNDDVVVYKMLELSEEIEEKFGNNLDKIISEACMLALKDQLSFISLHRLSQRLVLPVSEVKERIMLLTILGRNLWEKLPNFQATIMEFTQEAVYSSILDSGAGPDLSEITSDYDDWTSEVDTEELRRIILSENEPPFMASVESLTSNGDVQIPPYPPDSVRYNEYMMIPRPLIHRSKSIEVLFMEQAVMEPEPVKDKTPDRPEKFNPPRRTVSESSIVVEDDSRKSSMCSVFVFEPIYEDLREKRDRRNSEGVDDTNVIIAENREDAWIHLKDIEHGKKDALKRAVVLSTSSIDSVSSRMSRPLRNSTQDSKDSISSISDNESTTDAGSDNQNPSKGRKISMPVFDKINEEMEHSTNNSNNIAEVRYSHITMIKPTPAIADQDGGINQGTIKDELEDTDNGETTLPLGRRRSSAEILVDVAHPLLTIGAPFIILVIGSLFKRS